MVGTAGSREQRAVSEAMSVAILVGFTVVVTASVGVGVLFVDDGTANVPSANFTFGYYSGNGMLVVTHDRGEPVPAGQIELEGPPGSINWSTIDQRLNGSSMVEPGRSIQLSDNNAWGEQVGGSDTVEVYYRQENGNRTLLDAWNG